VGHAQNEAEALSSSFRRASRKVLPAVVSVRPISGPAARAFNGPDDFVVPRPDGSGSGVVIDADKGYVLTNDHVVKGASRVAVVLQKGRERLASQIRRDPKSDLALLIIDAKGLTAADWGDSEALDTGDWVLAIGQPYGLSDTVTAGIVSGKGRVIGVAMYEDLIQTDAAINPGNSGGPLVNLKGEIIGINTAIQTRHGGFDGVGFAIPSSRARRVASDLAELGRVRRAYLGMHIGPVDRRTAERLDQPGAVRIDSLTPGGPAAKAGLKHGDVILQFDGKPVLGVGPLQAALEISKIGAPVTLSIERDGVRQEISANPQEQPDTFGLPDRSGPPVRGFPGARYQVPGPRQKLTRR
jgi:serine protease Do